MLHESWNTVVLSLMNRHVTCLPLLLQCWLYWTLPEDIAPWHRCKMSCVRRVSVVYVLTAASHWGNHEHINNKQKVLSRDLTHLSIGRLYVLAFLLSGTVSWLMWEWLWTVREGLGSEIVFCYEILLSQKNIIHCPYSHRGHNLLLYIQGCW